MRVQTLRIVRRPRAFSGARQGHSRVKDVNRPEDKQAPP